MVAWGAALKARGKLRCGDGTARNRILPEGDVVRPARDLDRAHGGTRGDREGGGFVARLRATVAGHLDLDDGTGARRRGSRWRRRLHLVLGLVTLLTTGECAEGDDGREQSNAHCGTPPKRGA